MSSYGMSAVNCTNYPPLQPNPDIDGIGVLSGFVATSYLTFICCAAKAYIDSRRESSKTGTDTPNMDIWSYALETVIVSFSDQQVITGISIIIGGITQLGWGLDLYHWQTVANLAWFSAFTHILTLTVLRRKDSFHRRFKIPRMIAMLILLFMLVVALYPVGYITTNSGVPGNLPAWCLYHPSLPWYSAKTVGYNWLYITLTFTILFFSYSTRLLLLFVDHLSDAIHCQRTTVRRSMQSTPPGWGNRGPMHKLRRSISAVLIAGKVMFTSIIWELTWLLLALAWGTVRIFVTRQTGGESNAVDSLSMILSNEDTWAFGQVVTMALLAIPFFGFSEALFTPPDKKLLRIHPERQDDISPNVSETQGTAETPTSLDLVIYTSSQIEDEEWYCNLVILWYLLCLNIGVDVIWTFPSGGGEEYFTSPGVSLSIIVYYIFWILLDFGLLWIPTLIFMDDNIQKMWLKLIEVLKSRFGKRATGKLMWCLRWGATVVLFSISVFFDYWMDGQGITWIDNLENL